MGARRRRRSRDFENLVRRDRSVCKINVMQARGLRELQHLADTFNQTQIVLFRNRRSNEGLYLVVEALISNFQHGDKLFSETSEMCAEYLGPAILPNSILMLWTHQTEGALVFILRLARGLDKPADTASEQ